jgi:hypothetical protein
MWSAPGVVPPAGVCPRKLRDVHNAAAMSLDLIIFVLFLGFVILIAYGRSREQQKQRRHGAAYARTLQQAIAGGRDVPALPHLLSRQLGRAPASGRRVPAEGWSQLTNVKSQEIKILMDVYQTMQRRLEHYRQLAITLVFGFFALFSLVDTALFKASDGTTRHAAEGIVMEALVLAALIYGHHLLAMVRKNFEETGAIIQLIERSTGMFELRALVRDGPLLPADWPTGDVERDEAEFRQIGWHDDIVPFAQILILVVGVIQAAYVWHEYGRAILGALRALF